MTIHYVSTSDNPQSQVDKLTPGDELVFRSGLHYGRITIQIDDVVIRGEAGAILDGTQPLDTGVWTLATDSDGITSLAGSGTWRTPCATHPWIVSIPEGQAMRIDSYFVGVPDTANYWGMSAYSALAVPDGARPGPDYGADWWLGIESMWVWNPNNKYLYLRYRNGRQPSQVRWSGGCQNHQDPPNGNNSVIWIYNCARVTVKDLQVQGCFNSIGIRGTHDVVIENCILRTFDVGVAVYGACVRTHVTLCDFNMNFHGTNVCIPLAKTYSSAYEEARHATSHQYCMYKFWHDRSDSTGGTCIRIRAHWSEVQTKIEEVPGEYGWNELKMKVLEEPYETELSYNHFERSTRSTNCAGDHTDVHHNEVHNMMDMAFGHSNADAGRNLQLHDNYAWECGYGLIRWSACEREAGDNFIYNNRLGALDQVSDFVLMESLNPQATSPVRVWYYNNSFSGGNTVWMIYNLVSMLGFYAVNNLLSNNGNTANAGQPGWPSEIGGFDYNSMSSVFGAWGNWYGGNNSTNMPAIWPCDQIEEDFILPAGHSARGTGLDISMPFTINGQTFEALPPFGTGRLRRDQARVPESLEAVALDRGWMERGEDGGGEIVAATLTVAPDSVLPGADVEISWTGSASARDWYALYKIGEEHEFDKYGWAYTSSCAGSAGTIKPSGACPFTMPDELGSYEFHLYADDGDNLIATSNQITVAEAEPEPEPEPPDEEMILAFVPVWVHPADIKPVKDFTEIAPALKKRRGKGK